MQSISESIQDLGPSLPALSRQQKIARLLNDSPERPRCNGIGYPCNRPLKKGEALCYECQRLTAQSQRLSASDEWAVIAGNLDSNIEDVCMRNGIPQRLLRMDPARINARLLEATPPPVLNALFGGNVPEVGFGYLGSTGAGKSASMAILACGFVRARVLQSGPTRGNDIYDKSLSKIMWVDWPSMTQWLRDADQEQRSGMLHAMSRKKLLVLDDIGRERRVGSTYADDFGASCLESVIAARERYIGLPILWTSNVDEAGLSAMYGAATVSRLFSIAPPGDFLVLPDLRRQA